MSKIVIVTDSTSYIPRDLAKKHNIAGVRQTLIWGEQTYRDGVDIQPDEFYIRLKTAKTMPSTSQASPATIQSIFQPLVEQRNKVIATFIWSNLAGTFELEAHG